jgi:hypothetical protein
MFYRSCLMLTASAAFAQEDQAARVREASVVVIGAATSDRFRIAAPRQLSR